MDVLFVAGFGPIVTDAAASHDLYGAVLDLPLTTEDGTYYHTEALEGVMHFGLWPLADAARSCFGTDDWPADVPVPQAVLEFEVADLAAATTELETAGIEPLVANREEPWGQTVTRGLDPSGLLVGLTETPWLREA